MKCNKCNEAKHENQMFYDRNTLVLYCDKCIEGTGVPSNELEEYLAENYTRLHHYIGRALGVRLTTEQLIYLFKYAQENGLANINQTIGAMIDDLMERDPLDVIALGINVFGPKKKKKEPKVSKLLKEKPVERQTINLSVPEEVETDVDNDGVITL